MKKEANLQLTNFFLNDADWSSVSKTSNAASMEESGKMGNFSSNDSVSISLGSLGAFANKAWTEQHGTVHLAYIANLK